MSKEIQFVQTFTYGSKQLDLYRISIDGRHFGGELRKGNRKKVEGDTTEVYLKLVEYLQQVAEDKKTSVTYHFATRHQKMVEWATHKAPTIWEWETLLDYKKNGKKGTVVFRPKQ